MLSTSFHIGFLIGYSRHRYECELPNIYIMSYNSLRTISHFIHNKSQHLYNSLQSSTWFGLGHLFDLSFWLSLPPLGRSFRTLYFSRVANLLLPQRFYIYCCLHLECRSMSMSDFLPF